MNRLGLVAGALCLAIASPAAAQITVTVTALGDRTTNFTLAQIGNTMGSPIVASECDKTITLRFNGVDPTRSRIAFYEGMSCSDPTVRNDNNSDTCDPLTNTPSQDINSNSEVPAVIPINSLFPCGTMESGTTRIWALAIDNTTDTVMGAGQSAEFVIAYDFDGPDAVTSFNATGGDSSITLAWDTNASNESYDIFFDANGCGPAGENLNTINPDNLPAPYRNVRASSGTTLSWPAEFPYGSYAAVAIRAIDSAGNVGTLSSVSCVQRVELTTWWDMYCPPAEDGGTTRPPECDRSSPGCSAVEGRSSGSAWWVLAALIGALALRRRS